MAKQLLSAHNLTDEEVLKEFVKRFQCDGAVLIYLDEGTESWFGRWRNTDGRHWVRDFLNRMQRDVQQALSSSESDEGTTVAFLK
ncbi:hypothetical protein [uncultured Hymenobacter sp.]|uniref:hypothetical protein n=1 Tax=uncultured Hymenobacter sp. TaxID=170016 RepID=UPI0035CAA6CF